jgi:ATP-binding cassette subfamily B protein
VALQDSSAEVKPGKPKKPNPLIQLLKPYTGLVIVSFIIIVAANGANLFLPKLVGNYIDTFKTTGLNVTTYWILGILVVGILLLASLQTILSVYLSEKIARDLRQRIMNKLSNSSFRFINETGPSELITIFTSDVNNVKSIASSGIVYILTAIILLFGSCILMLTTDWFLGLIAISILPIIVAVFTFTFSRISPLFRKSQQNLGEINQVVNESIFGSTLVRVLNSKNWEFKKFETVNQKAQGISLNIVNLFSLLIPSINLVSNMAIILILYFGSQRINTGNLSLGEFASFITYFGLLITPIFILGFTSQQIGRGVISIDRIQKLLDAPNDEAEGTHTSEIRGEIEVKDLHLDLGGRNVLKGINFSIKPGTRTAILGPTGAGKSQLFSLLIGLTQPTSGDIYIDHVALHDWDKGNLLNQVGIVFQDSLVFKGSLKENIVFSNMVGEDNLKNAIYASKLDEFVETLENGINTQISERGSTLSGGQKQRLMLARSLALQPKILLLDDFTARVDNQTEADIWKRLKETYPDVTLVSITQKIDAIKDFDQVIVLMEGELVGIGTHQELLENNVDYQHIYSSQQTV